MSAQRDEHDWMGNVSDQYISTFALFVNWMSAYIEQEAKKYGFQYIEMGKELFENVAEQVVKSLSLGAS